MRQSGATTKQMAEAPRDSIYVWCNSKLDYPKALARHLGRGDLRIVSPGFFERGRYDGIRNPIVIDHATSLLPRQLEAYKECIAVLSALRADHDFSDALGVCKRCGLRAFLDPYADHGPCRKPLDTSR